MTSLQIDRLLNGVIERRADAIIFKVGERPAYYLNGRVVPLDTVAGVLSDDDYAYFVESIVPACPTDHGATHTKHSFAYGTMARFDFTFNLSDWGERLVLWRKDFL